VASGLETWPDGTVTERYGWQHAVHQEVVYARVPEGRRLRLHRRIGAREETGYGAQAGAHAAELAVHFARGQDYPRAVHYLQQAAENALRRWAYREAIDHLTTALELLQTFPETPERARQEFDLQTILGQALMATQGYAAPPAGQAYTRAYALGQQVDDPGRLFPVLHGLYRFHLVRGALQTAREVGEQSLTLARRLQDPALLLDAHQILGVPSFWLGDLATARAHLEQGMALYNAQEHHALAFLYGQDLGVVCLSYLAYTLCLLGYPAQALQRGREALTLAQELTYPFSLAAALNWAAWLHHFRREPRLAHERAEAARKLSTEQGFPFRAAEAAFWEGWALAAQGHRATGVAQMRQSLVEYQATGAALSRPYYLALLAEACGHAGQVEEGLRLLREARTLVTDHAAHWCEAEIHRLRGELLRQQPVPDAQQAEASFWRALEVACRQQAKSLELRAAASLARLWQQQGKQAEAHELLAPIYGWFTEGFDTADLQEAQALLAALT
jgi:predicted ATPase